MSAIAAINTWLNEPADYQQGLLLFKAYAQNTFLIDMLECGPDNYNRRKLQEELEHIAETYRLEQEQRAAQQPAILVNEKGQAEQLLDERAALKSKIRFLAGNPQAQEERKALAFEVLRITMRLDDIYNTKEFYQEHGYLPTGKLEVGDDPVGLKARQTTVRTYVSKYAKAGKAEKLKKYAEELAIIDKKLASFIPQQS